MSERAPPSIWWFALGYLAAYAPYGAITKALTKGLGPAAGAPVGGVQMLPLSATASMFAMVATLSALRWWRYAGTRQLGGVRVPFPGRWTFLSGVATAAIVLTTTFAYTIPGASIVLMMVLMRGGVLAIAPIVDLVTGRRVRWWSWVALALSVAALGGVLRGVDRATLPVVAVLDVGVYLAAYFGRLRTMTRLAKGSLADNRRYFVEEQLVATPVAVAALVLFALLPVAPGPPLREGFGLIHTPAIGAWIVLVGVLSQGTGVFGGLILLDPRENSFCVPVNRASSMIAGVIATFALSALYQQAPPPSDELVGAALMILATIVLAAGPSLARSTSS